jgi:hypothetical protein
MKSDTISVVCGHMERGQGIETRVDSALEVPDVLAALKLNGFAVADWCGQPKYIDPTRERGWTRASFAVSGLHKYENFQLFANRTQLQLAMSPDHAFVGLFCHWSIPRLLNHFPRAESPQPRPLPLSMYWRIETKPLFWVILRLELPQFLEPPKFVSIDSLQAFAAMCVIDIGMHLLVR